jgi:hypothetical protein
VTTESQHESRYGSLFDDGGDLAAQFLCQPRAEDLADAVRRDS